VLGAQGDLVYFAGFVGEGGEFIREARAAGYNGAVLGPDSFDTPQLVNLAGPLLVDSGGTYYTASLAPSDAYPGAEQFAQDFEILYGTAPMAYAAQGYDAVGICLEAIREASGAKDGELPTRKEVAAAVRALKDYNGITGTYNFNGKGDPALLTYFVYKVVSIDPGQWAQNTRVASFELPPPK
jgi:branched-chain amino acid transport system substrate-binding protein